MLRCFRLERKKATEVRVEAVSRETVLVTRGVGEERTQESWQPQITWTCLSVMAAESVCFCLTESQSVFSHLQSITTLIEARSTVGNLY